MKKDKALFYSVLITMGVFLILLIVADILTKSEEDNAYNKLIETYTVITEDKDELLIYDKQTFVVYKAKLVNDGYAEARYDIDSYFAENGLPYRYNIETEEIEMITNN